MKSNHLYLHTVLCCTYSQNYCLKTLFEGWSNILCGNGSACEQFYCFVLLAPSFINQSNPCQSLYSSSSFSGCWMHLILSFSIGVPFRNPMHRAWRTITNSSPASFFKTNLSLRRPSLCPSNSSMISCPLLSPKIAIDKNHFKSKDNEVVENDFLKYIGCWQCSI